MDRPQLLKHLLEFISGLRDLMRAVADWSGVLSYVSANRQRSPVPALDDEYVPSIITDWRTAISIRSLEYLLSLSHLQPRFARQQGKGN